MKKNHEEVAVVLDALVALLAQYEVYSWPTALKSNRDLVVKNDEQAYALLRSRFDDDQFFTVRIGLGDPALNAELDSLRDRLWLLVHDESQQVPTTLPCVKPVSERLLHYSVDDHQLGDVLVLDGYHFRATKSTPGLLNAGRNDASSKVWKQCAPVSIEHYRRVRRRTMEWWMLLAAAPVGLAASALLIPLTMVTAGFFMLAFFALFFVAATKVSRLERASSTMVAVFSEAQQEMIRPVSRGSRPGTHYFGDLAVPALPAVAA